MKVASFVTVCVVVLLGLAFAFFRHVDRTHAQPIRNFSKMASVKAIVSEALSAHYQKHGRYPHSLGELSLDTLQWGDEGSSARDVGLFTYVSDGSTFTMTWTNAQRTEVYLGGRTGQMYYQR